MTQTPIPLLRSGDLVRLGYGEDRRTVRVVSWREKPNGTGFDLFVIDADGNRSAHGFIARDPNAHRVELMERPDPQTWNGSNIEPRPTDAATVRKTPKFGDYFTQNDR